MAAYFTNDAYRSEKEVIEMATNEKAARGWKYRLFCIRWLWQHRSWKNTRQKFKAMEREWKKRGGSR